MTMTKYQSKPVVVEAVRYMGIPTESSTPDEIAHFEFVKNWCDERASRESHIFFFEGVCAIKTLEGEMRAQAGDYIICGTRGELYPCKPDVFTAKYEEVDGESELTRLKPEPISLEQVEEAMDDVRKDSEE